MEGLLVSSLFLLCLPMGREGADEYVLLVAPPPRDLSSNVEIAFPPLKPEPWRVWDNITETIETLITDKEGKRYFGDVYDSIRSETKYCDFLTSFEPLRDSWYYTPGVCVPADECVEYSPFELTAWGNKSCRILGKKINLELGDATLPKETADTFVCCPLNGTQRWKRYVETALDQKPERRYLEFSEIPASLQMENVSYFSVSARNYDHLQDADKPALEKFLDEKHDEAFEGATVCGFEREVVKDSSNNERDVYDWYPYFCVKPNECGKASTRGRWAPPANPLWHQFCSNKATPEINPVYGGPRYIFKEESETTVCCHVNDVGEKYLKYSMGGYVATSQMPTFLKYAPGLRSVYKCEEYAKQICNNAPEGGLKCVEGSTYPPAPGENPHMASLGVIVLKIMIFHCGGALISLRYIISTAGCRHWLGYQVNVVMLGEHETSSYEYGKENFYLITEITQPFGYPPAFRPKPWQDSRERPVSDVIDLALYKTEVEVEFTRYVRPACLWHGHRSWTQYSQFLGWGSRDSYRSEYLETLTGLKERPLSCTSTSFLTDEVENPFYGRFGAANGWMVCMSDPPKGEAGSALPEGHKNPCLFDLGGPLQEKLTQPYCSTLVLGVLSSRNLCKRLIPSVFINISQFLGAIEDEVWGNYLFLDLTAEKFEEPTCFPSDGLFFFNKCNNGSLCL